MPYQWSCDFIARFYKKEKQGWITAFTLKQRNNDQNHLLNNWIVIMANEVYEFMTAVRGYHYYKTYWNLVCNQTLYCSHEVGNPFDPFAIKVCKDDGEIVGYLPMETSRITKFLLDRGCTSTEHLAPEYYRRSSLMQGGLEIPCKMAVTMDIWTKWQHEVLDRYKELVYSLYFEPPDGEDIVGSFQKKDHDALLAQLVPRKRKSEPENRSTNDESGLKDIRFFTCTTRKTKKVLNVKITMLRKIIM